MTVKPECIYIATRLSAPHPIEYIVNLRQSFKAAAEVWRKGHYPFVPGYDFFTYLELDNEYGLAGRLPYEASLEWMRRCDAILVVNGLLDKPFSPGVRKEWKEAKRLGMKIYYSLDEIPEVAT